MGDDERRAMRRRAMGLLARREHSRAELARKLGRGDAGPEAVAAVLDELEADGLQDDARYAEACVRSMRERGKGPSAILAKLGQCGVADAISREALAAIDDDWVALARAALLKRFGDAAPGDLRERARRLRFLARRGFTESQARAALGSKD